MKLRPLTVPAASAALLLVAAPFAGAAGSGGVTDGPAFYIDGETYRTVATPTDLSHTGAPAHSYDTIYAFPDSEQLNVADAAPGHGNFNGGRWQPVTPRTRASSRPSCARSTRSPGVTTDRESCPREGSWGRAAP